MSEENKFQPMNPEIKAKWLDALRSGKYAQTTGQLRTGKGEDATYCCLGVLAEVAGVAYTPTAGGLSDAACVRAGFLVEADVVQHTLWSMNDWEGKTFPEIANWIETNL